MIHEPNDTRPLGNPDMPLVDTNALGQRLIEMKIAETDEHVPARELRADAYAILRVTAIALNLQLDVGTGETHQGFVGLRHELFGRERIKR
jgi:hypothetical protein